MPKDFETWIADFNKQKNWAPIVVPGGKKGAIRSPQAEMQSMLELSKANEAKLAKELGEMNATVTDLVRKVRDEHRDLEKFRLENDLKIAQKKRTSLDSKHSIAQQLNRQRERLIEQMEEMEGATTDTILDLHADIVNITSTQTKKVEQGTPSRLDYDLRCQEVQNKIDKARKTPIHLRDPSLSEAKTYNGISKPDYTLLQMMLQKADAFAEGGDNIAAGKVLDETLVKLDEITKTRRGVILAQVKPDRNPEVATFVTQVLQAVTAMRSAGLETVPDNLEEELKREDRKLEVAKSSGLDIKKEDLIVGHSELAERCTAIAGRIGAYKKATAELERLFNEINLLNAQDAGVEYFVSFMNHVQAGDIEAEIDWILDMNQALEKVISRERNAALSDENISMADLRHKLDSIKENVETMFKHHKDGSRVTDKDAKSQEDKDMQKDKEIKREALDEIAVRLKMADLLLESNSVDAMKRASAYLKDLEEFETDIKDNSDNYKVIEDGIKYLKDVFTKLQKKYTKYLLDDRSELKIATDAFEKDYKKQAPKTNTAKLKELTVKAEKILADAVELKKQRVLFDEKAKKIAGKPESEELGGMFAKLGKLLKEESKNREFGKVQGYYGEMTKRYAEARAEADKYDKLGLTKALTEIDLIEKDIDDQVLIVAKLLKAKGELSKLDPAEIKKLSFIRSDALKGQKNHDAEMVEKEKWEKAYPILKERIDGLKDTYKHLKLDLTDVDLASLDLQTAITEQKSVPNYAAAMKEHDRIKRIADELEKVAKELNNFKEAPLDKAAVLVCNQVEEFVKFVDGFEEAIKKVDPKAEDKYDLSNLKTFLGLVKEAVPAAAIKGLRDTTKLLAKNTSLTPEGRELREKALGHVRLISGRLRTSAPIKHFQTQTFVSDATLDAAIAALDRLQIKLLTALK